jgi:DNA replication protein DnaC
VNAFHLTDDIRRDCGLTQDDAGAWLCTCGAMLEGQNLICAECRVQRAREEHARAAEAKLKGWQESIRQHAKLDTVPPWDWARLTNAEFTSRIRGKLLLKSAQTYKLAMGSLILSARTGLGKTALTAAMLHRMRAQEVDKVLADKPGSKPTDDLQRLRYLFWTDGFALAQARRQQPLGQGEARIVERSFDAQVLVIDEVGFEPLYDTVIAEIANARYVAGLPTIITTGLRPDEFRERYGDACYRRFAERGSVVEER